MRGAHVKIRPVFACVVMAVLMLWAATLQAESVETRWLIPQGSEGLVSSVFNYEQSDREFVVESISINEDRIEIGLEDPVDGDDWKLFLIHGDSDAGEYHDCRPLSLSLLCVTDEQAHDSRAVKAYRSWLAGRSQEFAKLDSIWRAVEVKGSKNVKLSAGEKASLVLDEFRPLAWKLFFMLWFAGAGIFFTLGLFRELRKLTKAKTKPQVHSVLRILFYLSSLLLMLLALSLTAFVQFMPACGA